MYLLLPCLLIPAVTKQVWEVLMEADVFLFLHTIFAKLPSEVSYQILMIQIKDPS